MAHCLGRLQQMLKYKPTNKMSLVEVLMGEACKLSLYIFYILEIGSWFQNLHNIVLLEWDHGGLGTKEDTRTRRSQPKGLVDSEESKPPTSWRLPWAERSRESKALMSWKVGGVKGSYKSKAWRSQRFPQVKSAYKLKDQGRGKLLRVEGSQLVEGSDELLPFPLPRSLSHSRY
mgnify:CR=1 FL=1